MSDKKLQFKKFKNFHLGEHLPTSQISAILDEKYDKEYFSENTLVADETANIYKNIKCGAITEKVFDIQTGPTGQEESVSLRTACVSKRIDGLVVIGADALIKGSADNRIQYSGGVYISLNGGKTYQLFDKDDDGIPAANSKIGFICSIREEKNFTTPPDWTDIPAHSKETAFVCGNADGELFYMIVYVKDDGTIAEYSTKLFYIYGYMTGTSYANAIACTVPLKTITKTNIGTIYAIESIDSKYILGASSGLYSLYVDNSIVLTRYPYESGAAYTVVKYGGSVYAAPVGLAKIIKTSDGVNWNDAYSFVNINNINKLFIFNDNLIGAGQTNYILSYNGTAGIWKETTIEISESEFNADCIESLYMPKLRKDRCFMASTSGLYISDSLNVWTKINGDSRIKGIFEGKSLFIYNDILYHCGKGIYKFEDGLFPIAIKAECVTQNEADSKYLAQADASATYLAKTKANELYMDAVLSSHEEIATSYYEWTIEDNRLPSAYTIRFDKLPAQCYTSGSEFKATINNEEKTWINNNSWYAYMASIQLNNTLQLVLQAAQRTTMGMPQGIKQNAINKIYAYFTDDVTTTFPEAGADAAAHTEPKTVVSKVPFNDAVLSVVSEQNFLKTNKFNEQLSSSSSKEIIIDAAKDIKLQRLYSDNEQKAYRRDEFINKISKNAIVTAGFTPSFLTTLDGGAGRVGEGQYKFFAGKINAAGLYASTDGLNWEQISLPTIGSDDLNNIRIARLAYINGKFVLASYDGTYFYTAELSDDATKWCAEGIDLKCYNNVKYGDLTNYNGITKIDSNKFVIYGSNSKGGCCLVTNFDTVTAVVGMGNNRVYSFTKIDDEHYICAANNGIYAGSSLTGAFTRVNVTNNNASNGWQWLNTYYDDANNVLIASGDGGDYNNNDATRKTDIWYSLDKGVTWNHANFVNQPMSDIRGFGRIFKCKNINNNDIYIAVGGKNNTANVRIFTSIDAVNWTMDPQLAYDASNHDFIRKSDMHDGPQSKQIVAFDGNSFVTLDSFKIEDVEIVTTPYLDLHCITVDNFNNILSANSTGPALYNSLNTKSLAGEASEKLSFVDETTTDQFSKNIHGAKVNLTTYFNDILSSGLYNYIQLSSLSFKTKSAVAANATVLKIITPDDIVLGISRPNPADVSDEGEIKYDFIPAVDIPANLEYVKAIMYSAPDATGLYYGGLRTKKHEGVSIYGIYSNGNIAESAYGEYSFIIKMSYGGITINSCIDKILSKITASSKLSGKYISFLGDSITTYNGVIPAGYPAFYPNGNVDAANKTWWKKLIDETGMKLLANASWSGSKVVGDTTATDSAYCAASNKRISDLSANGISPDIIVCMIGTNDVGQPTAEGCSPIGNYDGTTELPAEGTKTNFADGYALMIKKIIEAYPKAQVFCCSLIQSSNGNIDPSTGYPYINRANLAMVNYNKKIEQLTKAFGCHFIDTYACGINFYNRAETLLDNCHPSKYGMDIIKEYVKNYLNLNYIEYPI